MGILQAIGQVAYPNRSWTAPTWLLSKHPRHLICLADPSSFFLFIHKQWIPPMLDVDKNELYTRCWLALLLSCGHFSSLRVLTELLSGSTPP